VAQPGDITPSLIECVVLAEEYDEKTDPVSSGQNYETYAKMFGKPKAQNATGNSKPESNTKSRKKEANNGTNGTGTSEDVSEDSEATESGDSTSEESNPPGGSPSPSSTLLKLQNERDDPNLR
jgi:hypothetical protein